MTRAAFDFTVRVIRTDGPNDQYIVFVETSRGENREVGAAFAEAFLAEMVKRTFEASGMCHLCTMRKATKFIRAVDGVEKIKRCDFCASMAVSSYKWEAIEPEPVG